MPPQETAAQREWIARVLGVAPGGSDQAALTDRLKSIGGRLTALRDSADPALAGLLPAFRTATEAMRGNVAGGAALIEGLEKSLAEHAAAAPDFAALSGTWRAARQAAHAALEAIGSGLLALDEVRADPRYKHVEAAIRDLPGLLPPDGDVGAGLAAGPPTDALGALRAYRQALGAVAALPRLETLAARHVKATPVCAPLEAALSAIEQRLSRAA